ncbi:hypothetical protein ACFFLS_07660 [Flavobacterium procerum]|uniref:DUF4292 domain-containing protein n=1 Tax=Flavobacterium procerum TaxID=1455569 RepID=A0ABV6BN92_9FLAO
MIRKTTQILSAVIVLLLMASCTSTNERIMKFVKDYNDSASNFSNQVISSTNAKAFLQEKKIEITMETTVEQNEDNKSLYGKIFPSLLKETIIKDRHTKKLIEEGVVFQINFLALDHSSLASFKIDKKEMEELLKNKENITDVPLEALSEPSAKLQQALAVMNKNMPIKNSDGTRVLKIYSTENNQLVYKMEVPEEMAVVLKNKDSNPLIKESLLRNTELKKIIGFVKGFGVTNIKYEYYDAEGNELNSFVLTEKDLSKL